MAFSLSLTLSLRKLPNSSLITSLGYSLTIYFAEPCPHSRHSPQNGNQALPISNGTSDNRTASETELDGVSCQLCKGNRNKTFLLYCSDLNSLKLQTNSMN